MSELWLWSTPFQGLFISTALETISFLFVQTYVVLCFVIYNSDKSVIVTSK